MAESKNEQIVMLPYLAHGHLIPFLALARQLQQRTGFIITIANTPLNIQYIRSTIASSTHPTTNIHLVDLPFSAADHGLPPNAENSEDLSLEQIGRLFNASISLKSPFHELVNKITIQDKKPPLCIISDTFFGWANEVAKSVGSLNVSFSTGGAYGTIAYASFWLNLPHRKNGNFLEHFNIPGIPERCVFNINMLHHFARNADGTDLWSRFMQSQLSESVKSWRWLCNTVEEIEPLALRWLRDYIKLPVLTIGPLLPPAILQSSSSGTCMKMQRAGKKLGISIEMCLNWLNLQNPGSVLYISFGSQNTISATQMMELAKGLEDSEVPFIWVIRPPIGFDRGGEFKSEWLPYGFKERVMNITKKGLLVHNWAPQLEILSHKSTGAFLSHCGWNSILESLSQGVPIIGWPLAAEQAYNSKMLEEEMGVGVELTRGVVTKIDSMQVKMVIDSVMDRNGNINDMKRKALEIRELIRASMKEDGGYKGSSVKAFDDFVNNLLSGRVE